MVRLSYTSYKSWDQLPSHSEFVNELVKSYAIPRYMIQVSYAFKAAYFSFLGRKLYLLVYSKKQKAWVIVFLHTTEVKRNFIPIIQEVLECTGV